MDPALKYKRCTDDHETLFCQFSLTSVDRGCVKADKRSPKIKQVLGLLFCLRGRYISNKVYEDSILHALKQICHQFRINGFKKKEKKQWGR